MKKYYTEILVVLLIILPILAATFYQFGYEIICHGIVMSSIVCLAVLIVHYFEERL